jgi:hypothetical protein
LNPQIIIAGVKDYKLEAHTIAHVFARSGGVGQPIAKLNALTRRLICQSPRAICSALKTQSSLDARPHRAQRSQSAQTKSIGFEDASLLASSPRIFRITVAGRIGFSF